MQFSPTRVRGPSKGPKPEMSDLGRPAKQSVADLPADAVQLLIERPLLGAGDVTIMEVRHEALLSANDAVLAVQGGGPAPAQPTLAKLVIDPRILSCQAIVDLVAARMEALPPGFSRRGRDGGSEHGNGNAENGEFGDAVHLLSFRTLITHQGEMPMLWHFCACHITQRF
jgi:hypothetical protein